MYLDRSLGSAKGLAKV